MKVSEVMDTLKAVGDCDVKDIPKILEKVYEVAKLKRYFESKNLGDEDKSEEVRVGSWSVEELINSLNAAIEAIAFKDYFDELYGTGLEVANWHLNGDLEDFDSFYDAALDEGQKYIKGVMS